MQIAVAGGYFAAKQWGERPILIASHCVANETTWSPVINSTLVVAIAKGERESESTMRNHQSS